MSDLTQRDTQTSDRAHPPHGVTVRSLLLALGLCILLNVLGARSYIVVNRYNGFTDHFNTIGVIFLLFLVALTSAVVARVRRKWALRPGE